MQIEDAQDGRVCRLDAEEVHGEIAEGRLKLIAIDETGDQVELSLDLLHLTDFIRDADVPILVDNQPPLAVGWDPLANAVAIHTDTEAGAKLLRERPEPLPSRPGTASIIERSRDGPREKDQDGGP